MSLVLNEPTQNIPSSNLYTDSKHAQKTYQTSKVLYANNQLLTQIPAESKDNFNGSADNAKQLGHVIDILHVQKQFCWGSVMKGILHVVLTIVIL